MNYRNYYLIYRLVTIFLLTASMLLISVADGFAQAKTISLKQAIDSAIQNYPELKARQLQIESAKMGLKDARDQRLPSLKLSDQLDLGTANSLPGSYFGFGLSPSTSGSIRASENTNEFSSNYGVAYLEYELFNFGLNSARIESAKSLINLNTADYNKESFLLQYQIAILYFDLLRYKLLTDIQQKKYR